MRLPRAPSPSLPSLPQNGNNLTSSEIADALLGRARCYVKQQLHQEAIQDYRSALEQHRESGPCIIDELFGLAVHLEIEIKNMLLAKQVYDILVELNSPRAMTRVACLYYNEKSPIETDHFQQAFRLFQTAYQIYPPF